MLTNVERIDIHGGSLRVFAEPAATAGKPSGAVEKLAAEEMKKGITGARFTRHLPKRSAV